MNTTNGIDICTDIMNMYIRRVSRCESWDWEIKNLWLSNPLLPLPAVEEVSFGTRWVSKCLGRYHHLVWGWRFSYVFCRS
jgi:hypothetical protein